FSATSCILSSRRRHTTSARDWSSDVFSSDLYPGDSVHTGSNGSFTLASTKRATTTTVTCSPSSVLDNTASTCTVTVADSSGAGAVTPTGSVSFTTNSTGSFSATTCTLAAGTCSVTYTLTVVG